MYIIRDTREGNSLDFDLNLYALEGVIDQKLDEGDYAVMFKDGTIAPIRVERKSNDIYSSLTSDYKRFSKEIERCNKKGLKLYIYIEKPLLKLDKYCQYKKNGKIIKLRWRGEDLVERLNTLEEKYDVVFKCWANREEMVHAIYHRFYAAGKQYIKSVKNSKKENTSGKKSKVK